LFVGLGISRLLQSAADYNDGPPCGKVAVAMRFLSLQSHVAYGYVGNRAATFPLQRLGHEVWAVNTVEFSNHTGYGAWRGRTASAEQVADIVHGIEALGMLARCDALLTGYVGDAALADVVLDTARRVRTANPRVVWCCDPVLGDTDTGIYVKPGIDAFFRDRALPAADLITPNHFELEHLTGAKVTTLPEALAAARSLLKGPRLALITSLLRSDAPDGVIEMLAVGAQDAWRIATPLIGFPVMPNGTGDTVAALFTAHWLADADVASALEKAASSIFAVLEVTQAMGERELQLVAAQEQMVAPKRRFAAERL
jgi:pyridoxine kinase